MPLVATAGCKFFIGTALAASNIDFTEASFASITWTEVDAWMTKGDLGDSAEEITTALINRGRLVKQKGTFDAGSMENVFALNSPPDAGQTALIAASKDRIERAFKVEYSDIPAVRSNTVTVTIAAPGVFTWNAHGLAAGSRIQLTTTGALPTGLTAATTYFVVSPTANTFSLSATRGGAAITTTGTQSGVHTATTLPEPSIDYCTGLILGARIGGGGANDVLTVSATLSVNSNVVSIPARG